MHGNPFKLLRDHVRDLESVDIEYRDWDAFLLGASDVLRTQRIRAADGYAREAERWRRGRFLGIPEAIVDALWMRGWEDETTAKNVLRPFAGAFAGVSLREFLGLDAATLDTAVVAAGAPAPETDPIGHRLRLRNWQVVLQVCRLATASGWASGRDVVAAGQTADGALALQAALATVAGLDSRSYHAALRNFGAPLAPWHCVARRALVAMGWLSADAGRPDYEEAMHRAAAQLGRHPIALTWLLVEASMAATRRVQLTVCDLRPLHRTPRLALTSSGDAPGEPSPESTDLQLLAGELHVPVRGSPTASGMLYRSLDRRQPIANLLRDLAVRPGGVLEFAAVPPNAWTLVRVVSRGSWPVSKIPRPQADW